MDRAPVWRDFGMTRKGIVLAGGSGTRMHPMTRVVSKQMLPVYDKPMIFYPLSTLMLAGIREILIISTPHDTPLYRELLGDGSQWGLDFSYAVQPEPKGLAQAYTIGRDFVADNPSALILGDNLFYGHQFGKLLTEVSARDAGCTLFAYHVNDPERYGVVELDADFCPVALVEKPAQPRSNYAVTGLYFYDGDACALAADLAPSARGELEITDLNKIYLVNAKARVEVLSRGYAWLDTGTPESLLQAGQFIGTVQTRQGLMIGCLEEIALRAGWIDEGQVEQIAQSMRNSDYGKYLRKLIAER